MANAAVRERDEVTVGLPMAAAPTTPLRAHRSLPTRPSSRPRSGARLPVVRHEAQLPVVPLPGFERIGSIDARGGAIARIVEGARGRLLVTTPGNDGVAVLDPSRMAVVAAAGDVYEPFAAVSAGGRAYVSSVTVSSDELAVIDIATGELQAVHPVMGSVRDVAASRDGSRVYVTRTDDAGADVAVFDTATSAFSSIAVGGQGAVADAVAVSGDGAQLYVGVSLNFASDLVVVDTATARIVGTTTIDSPIRGIAPHPNGVSVFVLTSDPVAGGAVHTVDVRSGEVTSVAQTGGLPTSLSISRDGGRLYVADIEQVTVLCTATGTVVDALTVDAEPSCVVESADGASLYVADYEGCVTVFALSGASPIAMPTIRRKPELAPV